MQEHAVDDNTLEETPVRFAVSCDHNGAQFCCPVCGTEYVHMDGVEVEQGTLLATITCDQVNAAKIKDVGKRGSIVRLSFNCEMGWHRFVYSFAFYKGNMFVDLQTGHESDGEALDELWRD